MLDQVSACSRPKEGWTDIENVFPVLNSYKEQRERYVLVTLVRIDGGSPRPLGAQMVVSESGQVFGHISGGCLKAEIIRQSLDVLKSGENRIVRYGKGSRYMDIVLPCGSGLDLYFDCRVSDAVIREAVNLSLHREPFGIFLDTEEGTSHIVSYDDQKTAAGLEGGMFFRPYLPETRLVVMGTDPAVISLARLGESARLDVSVFSTDSEILDQDLMDVYELPYDRRLPTDTFDRFTACVLFFHDAAIEIPLLQQILRSSCFYIGAQGSRRTHQNRVDALLGLGMSCEDVERIRGPLGIISKTRSPVELAISTLAEIVQCSRDRG